MPAKATKALEDFHTITPHLTVRGVTEAIAFYTRAFGAAELHTDGAGVGARRQPKIEFHPMSVAVIRHVDTGVEITICHAREGRQSKSDA